MNSYRKYPDRLLTTLLLLLVIHLSAFSQDAPKFDWARQLSVSNGNEHSHGFGVSSDAAGNVYSTGSYNGVMDLDPGAGVHSVSSASYYETDIYISKLDADGNFVWGFSFGSGGRNDAGFAIVADAAGNTYTTGVVYFSVDFDPGPGVVAPTGSNAPNVFILKLDKDGNFVWVRKIGNAATEVTGKGITLDNAGNVLSTGYFNGTVDLDPGAGTLMATAMGADDTYVSKLDQDGNFVWGKTFAGPVQSNGFTIDADGSNNAIIGGYFAGTVDFDPGVSSFPLTAAGGFDAFITKLDATGNFVWAKSLQGSTEHRLINSVATDVSGNVMFTGNFKGTVDLDPSAGVLSKTSSGDEDIFIGKLDAGGGFSWATTMGGSVASIDHGNAITVDASGNILATGYFNGVMDFDPGAGTFNLTGGGGSSTFFGRDFYVLKLTNSGSFIWAVDVGSVNNSDEGNAIGTDAAGNIYLTGSFETLVDFDWGPCTSNLNTGSANITAGFITKLHLGPTYLPTVTSISPTSGPVGTGITINGNDFSPVLSENLVRFAGTSLTVTAATSTSINVTVPSRTNGTYDVTLMIGCFLASNTQFFTITSGAGLTINTQPSPATVCSGAIATFTTSASGTTNILYQWQFSTTSAGTYSNISNGGGYSNVTTASFSVNTTGNFGGGYYRCKVDGDASATKFTNVARLIVNTIPLGPTTSNSLVCSDGSGGTAFLYASGGSGGNYRWWTVSSGGTAISGQTNSSYFPFVTVTTTFYVSIANGTCIGPRTAITANVEPRPPKPTVTSNKPIVNNEVTGCPGEVILYGPPGYDNYLWNPVEDGDEHWVVLESGAYSVRVTGSNGCDSEYSDDVNVTIDETNCVNAAPVITFESISIPINGKVTLDLIPTLSDSDDNIDLESLSIVEPPQSGADATINGDGVLEIDYASVQFSGTDRVTVGVCDYFGECAQQELEITVIGDIIIYNGISPNKDEANDVWIIQYIDAIEETKNNKVSIYNRWGDEVFTTENYNNVDRVFKGLSKNGTELSSGTYFYKIEFTSGKISQTGYLTLKK